MGTKRWTAAALAMFLAFGGLTSACRAQATDPVETKEERDTRMQWWREARFGMFIHWGVYSVPAGFYHDKPIGGIGEWIMHNARIPVAEYRDFAKQFNPVKYDAEAWVRTAKAAGMKYMVITSKHHDGFAMFDSKASDWNIVKATPYGKDVVKALSEACAKEGMRLGFYYSQAQDWNNRGAAAGGHWDKAAQDGSMDDYIDQVAVPQVKEILSNYGKISVLWWDTPVDMNRERAAKLHAVLKLQPGIINNNRLGGGFRGDTETPEQFIPPTGYPGRDWETCMTLNNTWGFKRDDNNWKPTQTLIRNLVDIASKGGNYLLNVGPTSLGEIPAPSVERLQEVGAWMKVNSPAIYATQASPFKNLGWGRCTRRGDTDATLFLHVFNWPADGKLVVGGLKSKATGAWLLSDPAKQPLAVSNDETGVTITVPATAPDPISSCVVLTTAGALEVEIQGKSQAADGGLKLAPSDAVCHGEVQVENKGGKDNLGFWTQSGDWVEYPFKAVRPGKYVVTAEIGSPGEPSLTVSLGASTVTAKLPRTGGYDTYQTVTLGTVELAAAGKVTLQLKPVPGGWGGINLRGIEFKPAP